MAIAEDAQDKPVALVTGASSGLGKVMAEALAAEGYRVFGTSRDPGRAAAPPGVRLIAMDVDDDASVENAVSAVIAETGRLDLLLCSAGFGLMGPIEDSTPAEMIAQFQTNVFGVHRACRAALPHLRRQPAAKIVVVGSLAGIVGLPYQGMYSASKFALEGYCEALRMELRDLPVRVALVQPGDFSTGFTGSRRFVADVSAPHAAAFARALAIVQEDEANGGDIALIADAIVRLAADPAPPLRTVVASAEQTELAEARPATEPAEWEALIAEHYGLEPG